VIALHTQGFDMSGHVHAVSADPEKSQSIYNFRV